MKTQVVAVDLGGSSGRMIIGNFDGKSISSTMVHKFSNDPVNINGILYWDIPRIFHEIKQGLTKLKEYGQVESIGIDTWGVDFGIIDDYGNLISLPIHYRDSRTDGIIEQTKEIFSSLNLYQKTGIQTLKINTLYQLIACKKQPYILKNANCILMIPDLINYFLTGKKVSEISIASTTQLVDIEKKEWDAEIISKIGIQKELFRPIIPSGVKIGSIARNIREELKVQNMDVIAVAGHDTQCAMVSIPTQDDNFVFISCGTWSLMGTEVDVPILSKEAEILGMTNEIGFSNKISFMKNIVGLWLIQECKRQWEKEGIKYSYAELEELAMQEPQFQSLINPDDDIFMSSGNMPKRIQEYCKKTKQKVPTTIGAITRIINESIALKYRQSFEEIKRCTNKQFSEIFMVGGGCQSELLVQMCANACGVHVHCGPVEGSVVGNMLIQLMSSGKIRDCKEARQVVKNSESIRTYKPENIDEWNKKYELYQDLIKKAGYL